MLPLTAGPDGLRRLARYDAVVFLNTSGDVLSEAQERAFRTYVEAGHGFVGVHAAAAAEPSASSKVAAKASHWSCAIFPAT